MSAASTAAVELAFRRERAAVLATLIRQLGDFQLAEDAVQEAFAAAIVAWEREGVPTSPGAWITVTARRRAIDRLRRDRTLADRIERLKVLAEREAAAAEEPAPSVVTDDQLRLIFTCCHPALAMQARVALTLRTLGGLSTGEIARAFLLSEPTMAQRLVRGELCAEAIRLARLLHGLMPDDPEVAGLLALMLLHDSRREARVDAHGKLVLLDDQDRSLWDRGRIREGERLLDGALRRRRVGLYQLQAAIAALHATAASPEETDHAQIAALYGELARRTPSPVVEVNRAVALGRAEGSSAGLAVLEPLLRAGVLDGYAPLHAAHADLLDRAGETAQAARAYLRAAACAENTVTRAELQRRATALTRRY